MVDSPAGCSSCSSDPTAALHSQVLFLQPLWPHFCASHTAAPSCPRAFAPDFPSVWMSFLRYPQTSFRSLLKCKVISEASFDPLMKTSNPPDPRPIFHVTGHGYLVSTIKCQ